MPDPQLQTPTMWCAQWGVVFLFDPPEGWAKQAGRFPPKAFNVPITGAEFASRKIFSSHKEGEKPIRFVLGGEDRWTRQRLLTEMRARWNELGRLISDLEKV